MSEVEELGNQNRYLTRKVTQKMREDYFDATGVYGTDNMVAKHYEQATKNTTPDYYGARCKCGRKLDWYVIGDAYRKDKGEAWSHACKKLLRAGEGHKPLLQDIDEVIDTLNRWKEQLEDKA